MDHTILLQRLQTSFGLISDAVLSLFHSYLDQRQQNVAHRGELAAPSAVFGVTQGSVLGPILLMLYTTDVVTVMERRGLSVHQYADDTQIYVRCHSNDATSLCRELGGCIEQVACWMSANRLQLNAAKTEFLCLHFFVINYLRIISWSASGVGRILVWGGGVSRRRGGEAPKAPRGWGAGRGCKLMII